MDDKTGEKKDGKKEPPPPSPSSVIRERIINYIDDTKKTYKFCKGLIVFLYYVENTAAIVDTARPLLIDVSTRIGKVDINVLRSSKIKTLQEYYNMLEQHMKTVGAVLHIKEIEGSK